MPTLAGNPIKLHGNFLTKGALPNFTLVSADLQEVKDGDFAGVPLLLNIFPSIDTSVCSLAGLAFYQKLQAFPDAKLLCISKDLPFALGRFCAKEGIKNLLTLSAFRSDFGKVYGVEIADSPLQGLLARSVIVTDKQHAIVYSELVPEIKTEPNYDKAIEALKKVL